MVSPRAVLPGLVGPCVVVCGVSVRAEGSPCYLVQTFPVSSAGRVSCSVQVLLLHFCRAVSAVPVCTCAEPGGGGASAGGGDPGPRAHTSCDSSPTVQPTVAQRSTALPRPAVPAATAHRRHPGREPGLPPPSLALVLPGVRGAPAPRGHGPPSPRLSPAVRGARLPALPRNGGWEAELSRGLAASARALPRPHGGWSGAHGLPRGTPAADSSALRPPASPPPSLTPLAGSLLGATPEPRPSRNLRPSCRGLGLVASEATRRLALSLWHACPLPGDFLVFLLP